MTSKKKLIKISNIKIIGADNSFKKLYSATDTKAFHKLKAVAEIGGLPEGTDIYLQSLVAYVRTKLFAFYDITFDIEVVKVSTADEYVEGKQQCEDYEIQPLEIANVDYVAPSNPDLTYNIGWPDTMYMMSQQSYLNSLLSYDDLTDEEAMQLLVFNYLQMYLPVTIS